MFLNLLQAEQGAFLNNLTTSEAFFMVIIVAVAGMLVQWRLKSVMNKYMKVPAPSGMTGAEMAELMLKNNGITDVRVISTGGYLTDHYDPRNKTVNLSKDVYEGRSIAAAAVACHECGHALQHAYGYAPLRMRSALVPVVQLSSQLAPLAIIAGLLMTASSGSQTLCWIGVGLMCASAIFSLITLPVEYNASARALAWMEDSGLLFGRELAGAKQSLRWAANTYLVAALSAIASILYYITLINRRN